MNPQSEFNIYWIIIFSIWKLMVVVMCAVGAVILPHVCLYALGFGSTGLRKKSLASKLKSVTNRRVSADGSSLFARLQSLGLRGFGRVAKAYVQYVVDTSENEIKWSLAIIGAAFGVWLTTQIG